MEIVSKILFVSPQFLPLTGGVPVLVNLIANEVSASTNRVTVVTSQSAAYEKQSEVGVVRTINPFIVFREFLRADKIIVVQDCFSLCWPLAFIHRPAAMMLQMHISHRKGVSGFLRGFLLKRILNRTLLTAASEWLAKGTRENLNWPCEHIPNPYDCKLFHAVNRPSSFRFELIFIGRLGIHKRCDLILQALAVLREKRIHPHLTIVGDGPERENLETLVRKLKLIEQVAFLGSKNQEEVAEILRRSRIMIIPSGYEPFGIVALEGLASGCHVITSDAGGLPEAGGGFAKTFRSLDPNDLAIKVEEVLKIESTGMSEALKLHLRRHTPAEVGRRYLELLETRSSHS